LSYSRRNNNQDYQNFFCHDCQIKGHSTSYCRRTKRFLANTPPNYLQTINQQSNVNAVSSRTTQDDINHFTNNVTSSTENSNLKEDINETTHEAYLVEISEDFNTFEIDRNIPISTHKQYDKYDI
jgi:hypothetical protein